MQAEIVLPEAKPEWEWVRGRALQKVSPHSEHSLLPFAIAAVLDSWGGGFGVVGPEWRFRISPPRGIARPLVPDVAFVRGERLRALPVGERRMPPIAPDVVVEILSPDDRHDDIADKIATYLAAGVPFVLVVDPALRDVHVHDADDVSTFRRGDVVTHASAPGLAIDVSALYARLAILDD